MTQATSWSVNTRLRYWSPNSRQSCLHLVDGDEIDADGQLEVLYLRVDARASLVRVAHTAASNA